MLNSYNINQVRNINGGSNIKIPVIHSISFLPKDYINKVDIDLCFYYYW